MQCKSLWIKASAKYIYVNVISACIGPWSQTHGLGFATAPGMIITCTNLMLLALITNDTLQL